MRLSPASLQASCAGGRVDQVPEIHEARVDGGGAFPLGPLEVNLTWSGDGRRVDWSVANRGDGPVWVRSIRLVLTVDHDGPLRMFRHGYQSWSGSGVATLGVDVDPSSVGDSVVGPAHHANAGPVDDPQELRSEMVTVLADTGEDRELVGFLGGSAHDGTFRLTALAQERAGLMAEAYLGGARLAAGAERALHPVVTASGPDHGPLLEDWAARYGRLAGARTGSPFQVGWCSWYHYFGGVTEDDIGRNLALADQWPFDVFQVDDGYQAQIGDWLETDPSFPSPLDSLAGSIERAGRRPGLWLAPFLAVPASKLAANHPEWIAQRDGHPLIGMVHDVWGGLTYTLDTTRPEVQAHLEATARSLVDAGFTYLKLDFTYAPGFDGSFADDTLTPAERVRAGYDAIRAGAGDDAFILGCGAPLGAVVGSVDAMRIGPDVAPSWTPADDQYHPPGYTETEPATAHAHAATLARSFMHRRLWLNDPDCLMLRLDHTAMTAEAVETWARTVGLSGGMALVSDDLALLDDASGALLDEVLAMGRVADAAAASGSPARCPDLLDHAPPHELTSGADRLVTDPRSAVSRLDRG